jgi:hypothetical protein
MERQQHILLRIILATLLFSITISLSGCRFGGGGATSPTLSSPVSGSCAKNVTTGMYSCGIQFMVSSTSGNNQRNSQISGVSVIVANPQ